VTVKEAAKLQVGDRVALARDKSVWIVEKAEAQAQYVRIKTDDGFGCLDLRGAAALRSLKKLGVAQ
jgi:hypothetical protein